MRDPHVVTLRYQLETVGSVSFENPQAIETETDLFQLRLENGIATLKLKEHFPSIAFTRNVVDEFFRAWELDSALVHGRRVIEFKFTDAEVVDRNPPPPGSPQVIELTGVASAAAFGSATLHVTRRLYPEPPTRLKMSPDVETLWQRYEGYLNNREPLPSMAYFCLTWLEAKAGSRDHAAKSYRIAKDVLRKLGELTALRGDEKTARKIKQGSTLVPLGSTEIKWIEASIKTVIRRVGEISSDPSLPVITMGDLPIL
jgi:hypothetical protein